MWPAVGRLGSKGCSPPSFPSCPPPSVTRPFPPGRSCPLHLTSTNPLLPTPRQMFRMNQIFAVQPWTSSYQVQSYENFAKNAFLTLKTKTPHLPSRPVRHPGDLSKPGRNPCCVFHISFLSFSYFPAVSFLFPFRVFHIYLLFFHISLLCSPYFPAVFFYTTILCFSYFVLQYLVP